MRRNFRFRGENDLRKIRVNERNVSFDANHLSPKLAGKTVLDSQATALFDWRLNWQAAAGRLR